MVLLISSHFSAKTKTKTKSKAQEEEKSVDKSMENQLIALIAFVESSYDGSRIHMFSRRGLQADLSGHLSDRVRPAHVSCSSGFCGFFGVRVSRGWHPHALR